MNPCEMNWCILIDKDLFHRADECEDHSNLAL